MKKALHRLATGFYLLLKAATYFLPNPAKTLAGRLIGRALMLMSKKRRIITYSNISRALGRSEKDTAEIAARSYGNLGITLIELLSMNRVTRKNLHKYISYENFDVITDTLSESRGLILLSAHYGNWELLAYSAGLLAEKKILIIARRQKNSSADRMLNRMRIAGGNEIVYSDKAAKRIVAELKSGGIVALLADQAAGEASVFVDFFGHPAATYATPAQLALKLDVPIVTGFAERQENGCYTVRLHKIEPRDFAEGEDPVSGLTEFHVGLLQEQIRKNPYLWAWQHRRWKYSPPDEY